MNKPLTIVRLSAAVRAWTGHAAWLSQLNDGVYMLTDSTSADHSAISRNSPRWLILTPILTPTLTLIRGLILYNAYHSPSDRRLAAELLFSLALLAAASEAVFDVCNLQEAMHASLSTQSLDSVKEAFSTCSGRYRLVVTHVDLLSIICVI